MEPAATTSALSLDQLQKVLSTSEKIRTNFKPFLQVLIKYDMTWIIKIFEELYRLMFEPKIDLTMKFNSIFALKFILDQSHFILNNFIEVYFLPKLIPIAFFECKVQDKTRGATYFETIGYPKNSQNIAKFGYNFVRLASEIITAAATIKPNRLFQAEEIQEPSDFALAYKELLAGGFVPYQQFAYIKGPLDKLRQSYLESLKVFTENEELITPYLEYFQGVTSSYIKKPAKTYLDFKLMLASGEYFSTSSALQVIEEIFTQEKFSKKIVLIHNALSLLTDFFRWGDFEAFYLVNNEKLLDRILKDVAENPLKQLELIRGKQIMINAVGTQDQKFIFYTNLLKGLQMWAICFPKAIKTPKSDSRIKYIHDVIRFKRGIEFPEDIGAKAFKDQFDVALKRNNTRNVIIQRQVKYLDPENKFDFIVPDTPKKSVPSTPGQEPSTSDYSLIISKFSEIKKVISGIGDKEEDLPQKIISLKNFKDKLDIMLSNEKITEKQFDELMNQGLKIAAEIDKIQQKLRPYQNKSVSFKDFVLSLQKPSTSKQLPPPKDQIGNKGSQKDIPSKPENSKVERQQGKKDLPIGIDSHTGRASLKEFADRCLQPSMDEKSKNGAQQVLSKVAIDVSFPEGDKAREEHGSLKPSESQDPPRQISAGGSFFLPETSLIQSRKRDSIKQKELKLETETKNKIETPPSQGKSKGEKISLPDSKLDSNVQRGIQQQEIPMQAHVKVSTEKREQLPLLEHEKEPKGFPVKFQTSLQASKVENVDQSRENEKQSQKEDASQKSRYSQKVEPVSIKKLVSQPITPIRKANLDNSVSSSFVREGQNRYDGNDFIKYSDNQPLQESYHEISEDVPGSVPSFKKCFQADKYLYSREKNQKMFWLQNDTKNLIKPVASKPVPNFYKINIPSVLEQRDKIFKEELRFVEQQKNRKINELESQVKKLETEKKELKETIIQQQSQLSSIKASSDLGSPVKQKFREDQAQFLKSKLSSANKSMQNYRPNNFGAGFTSPLGKLISTKAYRDFFLQFSSDKDKKAQLKNKGLLLKNQCIQFGCMTRQEGENLIITFFITPEHDLSGLTYQVKGSDQVITKCEPKQFASIGKGKQDILVVTVSILKVPYKLPEIDFFYSMNDSMKTHTFVVPCGLNKFVHIAGVNDRMIEDIFSKEGEILRAEEVPYSKRMLKNFEDLGDYFPTLGPYQRGEPSAQGEIAYCGLAAFKTIKFYVKFSIKPNQFLYVQAVPESPKQPTPESAKIVECYLSLVTYLLSKNINAAEL